ncbi:MAG TPA: DUF11 domain-containing protein, partial [Vitreimonas sp.]|nr:DUF11 domain-containing protein [Vitreimonas sp.]
MSRGIWWYMSARTRRSITFFWTALFVLSLLMQYASFASAPPIAAVHNEGLFELEGDATNNPAVVGDDWSSHPGATGSHFVFINDPVNARTDNIFTGGGSKDDLNTTSWAWTTGTAPDKDDISHAFAAAYESSGNTFVYFGLDRYANNGDAQVGFWFFRNGIATTAAGGFTPAHSVGDLLVLSDFTNGGAVSTIKVYEWVGSGGNTNGTLDLLATGNVCTGPVVDTACAIANTSSVAAPWSFTPKFGTAGTFPPGSFFEGGINLNALFGGNPPCFSGFLAETRASQSVDAVLKDFALGNFDTCEPPDIATQVQQGGQDVSVINVGESVVDVADLTTNSPLPTGTIDFFLCGPHASQNPDCSSGGTKLGSTKTLSGGMATSDAFTASTPSAAGFYCFRAEYTPDAAGSDDYLRGSHTNLTTECFRVVPAQVTISKTAATATVSAGSQIGFTLSWGNSGSGSAAGVAVSDNLPGAAGLDWSIGATTGSGTGCAITGAVGAQVLDCAVGTVPGNTATHGTVTVVSGTTAASCDTINNTGNITSTNDGSDSDSASVVVQCPDVKVTKTPDGGSVDAGDQITWTIKVENLGPGTATGVTLTDNLPAGIDWSESEADCSITGVVGSQVLDCTVGTLASVPTVQSRTCEPTT